MAMRRCALAIIGVFVVGCGAPPRVNPSFSITRKQAHAAIREMEKDPRPLQRPLVILGGFSDPGFNSTRIRSTCRRLFEDDDCIILVNFVGATNFHQCTRRVIEAVEESFPCDDPTQTTEVDVIGLSMGGLVARIAAEIDQQDHRRLRIARLFTISSPHRGAKLAQYPLVLTSTHRDMRQESDLMQRLSKLTPPYPIFAYTRLHDSIVGEELAAPVGQRAWWVDSPATESAHFGALGDPRIVADIARRLRGEMPFTTEPPAPLPSE